MKYLFFLTEFYVFSAFGKPLCSVGQWQHRLHWLGPLHPSGLLTVFLHITSQIRYYVLRSWTQTNVGLEICTTAGPQKKQTIMFLCWSWLASCLCFTWVTLNYFFLSNTSMHLTNTSHLSQKWWHVFIVSDFHQNIKELESSCGNQSDDCTTLCQQCLRYRPCGTVGFVPSGSFISVCFKLFLCYSWIHFTDAQICVMWNSGRSHQASASTAEWSF